MKDVREDIKIIRESQIRMEEDIKYHILRTDNLEDMVMPVYKVYAYIIATGKVLGGLSLLIGIMVGLGRLI